MAHPDVIAFQRRISNIQASGELTEFCGKVYRSASPKYATKTDLLTGKGAKMFDGRWNPKGLAVVYASLSMHTALDETLSHFHYYGLPDDQALPRTFCGIELALAVVLDLRIGRIRSRLRLSFKDLTATDWRKTSQGQAGATNTIPRRGSTHSEPRSNNCALGGVRIDSKYRRFSR